MKKENSKRNITGRYVYDKELGQVVKVSDEIPGISGRKNKSQGGNRPCNQECRSGPCPMSGN